MLELGKENEHNHCYQYVGRDDMFAIHRCNCGAEILQDIMDFYEEQWQEEENEDYEDDYNDIENFPEKNY